VSEPGPDKLVVAITARALFDLEKGHALFEEKGLEAYAKHQRNPRGRHPRAGHRLSAGTQAAGAQRRRAGRGAARRGGAAVSQLLRHRAAHLQLDRAPRAADRARGVHLGRPTTPYIQPFGAQLFLSANPHSVRRALADGVAAATILPAKAAAQTHDQLRIAFDGDAVIFGDESERVSQLDGLAAFHAHETERAHEPLSGGPFRGFLAALHKLQSAFPAADSPIRTALVTARSAPAHKRVILTLREWGVRLDEALFLGGRDKGPFLATSAPTSSSTIRATTSAMPAATSRPGTCRTASRTLNEA
jgi:5'-nucleotidase